MNHNSSSARHKSEQPISNGNFCTAVQIPATRTATNGSQLLSVTSLCLYLISRLAFEIERGAAIVITGVSGVRLSDYF